MCVCVLFCVCVCERARDRGRTNLSLLPNHFTLHWGPSSFVNGLLVETRQAETLETWPRPLKGTAFLFRPPQFNSLNPTAKQLAHKHLNISFKRWICQLAQEVILKLYTNQNETKGKKRDCGNSNSCCPLLYQIQAFATSSTQFAEIVFFFLLYFI